MNDEQRILLEAYHDGELDQVGIRAAQSLVDTDPDAWRYWRLLQQTDSALHAAFDPILHEPIPPGMLAVARKARYGRRHDLFIPLALAAGLMLVAVLVVRQESLDGQMNDQIVLMQQEIVQLRNEALENMPSGMAASWVAATGKARAEVLPIKTYRTGDNRFCREYEERIEDAQGVEIRRGIACRTGKASWPDRADPSGTNRF